MSGKSTKEEVGIHLTYYFTVMFMVIGTLFVFFLLYQKMEKLNFFIILLSTTAGGIPFGFIGAFIDYKISEYKFEKRGFE